MANGNFETCLAVVLVHEGGWSDNPRDPGGATMRGVTQAVYDAYRKRSNRPLQTVRKIGDVELRDIYRAQYWNVIRGDDLPPGIDLATFDFAVNSGAARAARYLQQVLGVTADGQIGELTLAAVRNKTDRGAVVEQLCAARLDFMKRAKDGQGRLLWSTFGKGWQRRVDDIETRGMHMAGSMALAASRPVQNVPPLATLTAPVAEAPPRETAAATAGPPPSNTAQTTEGKVAIAIGALGGISTATSTLQSVRSTVNQWTEALSGLPALGVVGILCVVAAILIWRARRRYLGQEAS